MIRNLIVAALVLAAPAAHAARNSMKSDAAMAKSAMFTVRIENVSTPSTLRSKSGETAPAPNSPGLWVLETKPARLFKAGKPQMGWGLEAQAEDGNPTMLAEHCSHHEGVVASGVFNTPVGDDKPGPALPGKKYEFTFTASPGQRLAFTTMFGQSNDLFIGPDEMGIALFDGKGRPVSGDITSKLSIWDAGTEVNEQPGFGPNQAPRQAAPNTGPSEKKPVQLIGKTGDGFSYPKVSDMIRVTLMPTETMAQH